MKEQTQVFYIHGGGAYSSYDAFLSDLETMEPRDLPGSDSRKKWSQSFVENLGDNFEVFMPTMPNKWNAKYGEWKRWFERYFEYLNDDTILVGVSLGAYFLVKYMSEEIVPFKVKALFLLAGPYENFVSDLCSEDGGDFEPSQDKVPAIQSKVGKITIMHSKDDFVVPYEHALKYKAALPAAELVTFEDKNHFLIEEFPELLERIKSIG